MRRLLAAFLLFGLTGGPCLACGVVPHKAAKAQAGTQSAHGHKPGAAIDFYLQKAKLPEADMGRLRRLREEVAALAAAGDEKKAQAAEEEAMHILGYRKVWFHCGPGIYTWMRIKAASQPSA